MPGSGRLSKDVRLQALDRVLEKTGGSHRLQAWDESREGPNIFLAAAGLALASSYTQGGRQAGRQGKARQGKAGHKRVQYGAQARRRFAIAVPRPTVSVAPAPVRACAHSCAHGGAAYAYAYAHVHANVMSMPVTVPVPVTLRRTAPRLASPRPAPRACALPTSLALYHAPLYADPVAELEGGLGSLHEGARRAVVQAQGDAVHHAARAA